MKRFLQATILVLLMALMTLTFAACGGNDGEIDGVRKEYDGVGAEYDLDWQKAYCERMGYTTTGEGITVDGVLDDAKWDEVYGLTYSAYTATVTMKTYFGKDGMYVAYEIKDNNVWFNEKRADYNNTSAEVLIAPYDSWASQAQENTIQLRLGISPYIVVREGNDGANNDSFYTREKPVFGGYKVQGEHGINTGKSEGLDLELFVGWDSLGYERDPETNEFNVPEKVKMYSQYNYCNNELQSSSRVDFIRPFAIYRAPRTWYYFDAQGYVNNDERIEAEAKQKDADATVLMGDSYTGLPKTWSWNLSKAGEGVYTTERTNEHQRLFVKDGYAENFVFSATVNRIGQDQDTSAYAHIGLMAMDEKSGIIPTSALVTGGGSGSRGKITNYTMTNVKYTALAYHNMLGETGSWVDNNATDWSSPSNLGNLDAFGNNTVKLTMVKYGASFAYFINGNYWKSVTNAELAGKACPGLVAHNVNAKFTDVTFSTDAADVAEALSNANLYVATINQKTGGTVTGTVYNGSTKIGTFTDTTIVKKGYTVIFNIKPDSSDFGTYKLKKFTVNGEEVSVTDNKYTVKVDKVITVEPMYELQ